MVDSRAIAKALTYALEDGWTVDQEWDANGAMIDHADGRRLHISGAYNKPGFVAVNAVYPYEPGEYIDRDNHVTINVRADRGAEVIAREIERRIMPTYVPALAALRERHEARDQRTVSRDAMVNRAYQILGKKRPERPDRYREQEIRNEQTEVSLYGLPPGYGDLTFHGDGSSVSVKMGSVPAQIALEILAVLVLHKDDEK